MKMIFYLLNKLFLFWCVAFILITSITEYSRFSTSVPVVTYEWNSTPPPGPPELDQILKRMTLLANLPSSLLEKYFSKTLAACNKMLNLFVSSCGGIKIIVWSEHSERAVVVSYAELRFCRNALRGDHDLLRSDQNALFSGGASL